MADSDDRSSWGRLPPLALAQITAHKGLQNEKNSTTELEKTSDNRSGQTYHSNKDESKVPAEGADLTYDVKLPQVSKEWYRVWSRMQQLHRGMHSPILGCHGLEGLTINERKVASLFGSKMQGLVAVEDVPIVMRACNMIPRPEWVEEVVKSLDPRKKGFVPCEELGEWLRLKRKQEWYIIWVARYKDAEREKAKRGTRSQPEPDDSPDDKETSMYNDTYALLHGLNKSDAEVVKLFAMENGRVHRCDLKLLLQVLFHGALPESEHVRLMKILSRMLSEREESSIDANRLAGWCQLTRHKLLGAEASVCGDKTAELLLTDGDGTQHIVLRRFMSQLKKKQIHFTKVVHDVAEESKKDKKKNVITLRNFKAVCKRLELWNAVVVYEALEKESMGTLRLRGLQRSLKRMAVEMSPKGRAAAARRRHETTGNDEAIQVTTSRIRVRPDSVQSAKNPLFKSWHRHRRRIDLQRSQGSGK